MAAQMPIQSLGQTQALHQTNQQWNVVNAFVYETEFLGHATEYTTEFVF
jgi:hypothetical protein